MYGGIGLPSGLIVAAAGVTGNGRTKLAGNPGTMSGCLIAFGDGDLDLLLLLRSGGSVEDVDDADGGGGEVLRSNGDDIDFDAMLPGETFGVDGGDETTVVGIVLSLLLILLLLLLFEARSNCLRDDACKSGDGEPSRSLCLRTRKSLP